MHIETEILTDKFSKRIQQVPRSFIRDILMVANAPEIISFAGGLPNKEYFPVEEIKYCADKVLTENGAEALQYSSTEGLPELREHIAERYKTQGLDVSPDNILITTGSQQALDLIGKVFINKGDEIIIEEPSYLGAIQAFSMYRPKFVPTALELDGIDTSLFKTNASKINAKMAYLVPTFQNPTGISYSLIKRKKVAELAIKNNLLLIEDDPYGLINFYNKAQENIYKFAPENTILLGTFSKSVAPGFRIGWIVAPNKSIYDKLVVAKQAADLHTDIFSQRIISAFLSDYDIDIHMQKIINAYRLQAETMIEAIQNCFPETVSYTTPQGGMFCWLKMPDHFSSMNLFQEALKENVAFVPGVPFYINKRDCATFRLNYSCSEPETIRTGIAKLAQSFNKQLMKI